MRLLRHQRQIDRIGEAYVEQRGHCGLGFGLQIVAGFVELHRSTPANVRVKQLGRLF